MSASQVNGDHWSYLLPELAYQITVTTHILAGTLSIMCWDILNNLNNDYRLLFKYRVGLPTVVYFISRLGALGYILTLAIAETAPVGSCEELQQASSWMYAICIPTTSLLFFFRVRAIFNRSKYVVWFFTLLWLGVVGSALTVPQAIFVMNISSTRYCTTRTIKPFAVVSIIVPFVNDTLVLLALTVGLVMNTHIEPNLKQGIRIVMYGDYLPAFSRAMWRDNQMYYLATVGCNLLTVVMFYANFLPVTYRTVFVVPNVMLMNIMACRVYRNTKFGHQRIDPTITIPLSGPIAFQGPNADSSKSHAPSLFSANGNQASGPCCEGEKLENANAIDIYSCHKNIFEMRKDRDRGDSAA